MARLYVLMGKSASGKDTIYHRLLGDAGLKLKPVVSYTTRPRREGEEDGREYYFVDVGRMQELKQAGKIIEHRVYRTVYGEWHYFTADDGQIGRTGQQDYLMIDTLAGYQQLRAFFGQKAVVPLYIEVEDGLRLSRALERERAQEQPKYEEMCRRFLADTLDFSRENLEAAGIGKGYENENLEDCVRELTKMLKSEKYSN